MGLPLASSWVITPWVFVWKTEHRARAKPGGRIMMLLEPDRIMAAGVLGGAQANRPGNLPQEE